jgi:hypothetical protein
VMGTGLRGGRRLLANCPFPLVVLSVTGRTPQSPSRRSAGRSGGQLTHLPCVSFFRVDCDEVGLVAAPLSSAACKLLYGMRLGIARGRTCCAAGFPRSLRCIYAVRFMRYLLCGGQENPRPPLHRDAAARRT